MERKVDAELADVLQREALTLVALADGPSGASRFVAHVRDATGQDLLLKRGTGLRGNAEAAVLQALASTGYVPGGVRVIDEATFVCEWLDGDALDPEAPDIAVRLHSCGEALRTLHGVPLPGAKLMPISSRVSPEWVERDLGPDLAARMFSLAKVAAEELADCNPADKVLLHGDVVPQNIIVSDGGVRFIDPIGFIGPAGWDVAQLAIAVYGRDRRANLADVVAGYGSPPPKLEPAFAYLAMVFYAKHLEVERTAEGSSTAVVSELRELAESLAGARR